ncbi:hypothetical protein ABZ930_27750 [Streptomyces sp. NPDC046716]|uniref:hypothetical protein n=1 Tax=Streptomyces sp. NPDC046716 TaxID=3157093 RepID=UPI0033C7989C
MHSRNVRIAVGAAAAVAALAVSGCSGDDGGSDKGAAGSSSAATPDAGSSDGSSDSGSGSGSGSGSSKDPVGIWSATTDGKPVVLVIGGEQASLSTGDGHLCTGTVTGSALSLTCADGDTARSAGTIESNDGSTMKVSWKAGAQDTFKKSANGQLPTDLPTTLPSGLPTG